MSGELHGQSAPALCGSVEQGLSPGGARQRPAGSGALAACRARLTGHQRPWVSCDRRAERTMAGHAPPATIYSAAPPPVRPPPMPPPTAATSRSGHSTSCQAAFILPALFLKNVCHSHRDRMHAGTSGLVQTERGGRGASVGLRSRRHEQERETKDQGHRGPSALLLLGAACAREEGCCLMLLCAGGAAGRASGHALRSRSAGRRRREAGKGV